VFHKHLITNTFKSTNVMTAVTVCSVQFLVYIWYVTTTVFSFMDGLSL